MSTEERDCEDGFSVVLFVVGLAGFVGTWAVGFHAAMNGPTSTHWALIVVGWVATLAGRSDTKKATRWLA